MTPRGQFSMAADITRITVCRIAQPPNAAFVARPQSTGRPDKSLASYQSKSTTLWVDSSSIGVPRRRGAR